MTTTIKVGADIEAWCTKCRRDTMHRVVAMVEHTAKRVMCLSCNGEHNYRAPKDAPAAPRAAAPARPERKRAARGAAAAPAARPAATRRQWEEAISGRDPRDFVPYGMGGSFGGGQLVSHKKFGEGVVLEVMPERKIRVLFHDGEKVLVHQATAVAS